MVILKIGFALMVIVALLMILGFEFIIPMMTSLEFSLVLLPIVLLSVVIEKIRELL
jgi:hypothetical protein